VTKGVDMNIMIIVGVLTMAIGAVGLRTDKTKWFYRQSGLFVLTGLLILTAIAITGIVVEFNK
jgi:hypothetical protein